ncbi:hypothetical protein [Haladaptatus sp. T7]|uniref:hypothetical protein n=1 Tax=Haladaptatus sp. T7 TaxID=2029368 RepID=UPI0021A25B7D|nr:hypothetical protein [Haladaptatus sp. T7]GKZ14161.1 hypothetical protein HAL_20420 [Haladaptatus sp. T7]
MGASIQQIWSDGVAPDDGRYDVNFKWGDHGGVKATNVSSNYLSTRANQYDEYLRNSSYWKKTYDDADGILLLDYNSGKDINLGDASACYGKIGGAAGSEQKTAIVDMAFFENATWEYDSGGFFADTFAKGTGFRAAGLLFNVYSDSAGTRTINGLPQYSLATRGGGLKSGASCGNVDSNASKQANFVSNCTQNQIQNWVDNYM